MCKLLGKGEIGACEGVWREAIIQEEQQMGERGFTRYGGGKAHRTWLKLGGVGEDAAGVRLI